MKKYSPGAVLPLFILLVVLILGNFHPANAESKGDAESLVKQSIMVWNTGNTVIADQIYSPDLIVHLVDQDNSEYPSMLNGTTALMDHLSYLRTAYPDMKLEPDHMSIDGNTVTTRITFKGTNTGPRGDLLPTNKKVKVSTVLISQIDEGKIAEEWLYVNMASVYKQLGFTITPPSAEK